jgi:WD40 repeat protein
LYNSEFEAVVSGDDGSFISVWDIETGKLMSKFGDAHGVIISTLILFRNPKSRLVASTKLRDVSSQRVVMAQHACGTSVTANV